jgi:hypothetical protein
VEHIEGEDEATCYVCCGVGWTTRDLSAPALTPTELTGITFSQILREPDNG